MKPFEKRLQYLNREMLLHACIGHPAASIFSLVGMRHAAEFVHYITLPPRARRKIPRWKVTFDHSPELILADVLFNPLAHVARSFGLYRLCNRIFFSGPWKACLRHDSCNMTPDESRWAKEQFEKLTGKGMYEVLGPNARPSIALAKMGVPYWSGQARGIEAPDMRSSVGGEDAAKTKDLFERLVDAKFTRRGLRRIEDLIGVEIKHGTSADALRSVILLLDFKKKKELARLLTLAESGSNLDAE